MSEPERRCESCLHWIEDDYSPNDGRCAYVKIWPAPFWLDAARSTNARQGEHCAAWRWVEDKP